MLCYGSFSFFIFFTPPHRISIRQKKNGSLDNNTQHRLVFIPLRLGLLLLEGFFLYIFCGVGLRFLNRQTMGGRKRALYISNITTLGKKNPTATLSNSWYHSSSLSHRLPSCPPLPPHMPLGEEPDIDPRKWLGFHPTLHCSL